MKILYVVDENGEFYSEDRKVRYKELRGKELHNFLKSNGANKFFSTDTDDEGNVIGVEIPLKHKAECEKERLRSRYLREVSEKYITISYEMSIGEDGDETLDAFIFDEEERDALGCLLERDLFIELKNIFTSLDKEEMDLLFKIFMSSEPLTEAEYAEEIGISQQAVHKKKTILVDKLKNYFQKFGC